MVDEIDWEARYRSELSRRRRQEDRAARANRENVRLRHELAVVKNRGEWFRIRYESSPIKQHDLLVQRLNLIRDMASLPLSTEYE